jgi:predicted TIM-barrel fold metal-dependent hydrolase
MIIDGHTHIVSSFSDSNIVDIKFDWNSLEQWFSSEPQSKCVIIPKIVQFCDSVNLNIDFVNTLNKFPKKDRVFPFLWIHPQQLMETHFQKFVFSGFKFHPSISQMTIDQNEELLNLCEKYEKPLLVHCGRNEKSRIDYVLKVNEHHPRLKFICAHLGGMASDLIVRAFEKLSQTRYLDNIYLDTSGCFHPELIEKAVQLLGRDKIVFGTDRPFHSYQMSLYAINCCRFDKETKENILRNNILNILNAK